LQVILWQQQADSGFKLATMVGIDDPLTETHLAVLFDLPALMCMPGFIVQSEARGDISSEPVQATVGDQEILAERQLPIGVPPIRPSSELLNHPRQQTHGGVIQ